MGSWSVYNPSCVNYQSFVFTSGSKRTVSTTDEIVAGLNGRFRIEADVSAPKAVALKYAFFIPGDSVEGPPVVAQCIDANFIPRILRFRADERLHFDPNPDANARMTNTLSIVADDSISQTPEGQNILPNGLVENSQAIRIGPTRSYAPPAFDDGIINDADDDGVFDDCYLAHQVARANTRNISVNTERESADTVKVRFNGDASDPLIRPKRFACSVDWDLEFTLNKDGYWTLSGTFNSFPSFELFAGSTQILGFSAGNPPFSLSQVIRLCNHFKNEMVNTSGFLD
jgi:hypothetical protein